MIIFGEFDQSNELKYLPNTKCFTNRTRTRFRNIFSHEGLIPLPWLKGPLQPVAPNIMLDSSLFVDSRLRIGDSAAGRISMNNYGVLNFAVLNSN